jgi:integrase
MAKALTEKAELTDAAVRRYVPGRDRRRIKDTGARSLYLIIEPTGFKAFEMRFRRPNGKPAKVRLGPFEDSGRELKGQPIIGQALTLAAAHQLAAAVLRDRALGHDVVADHKAKKHRARVETKEREASTFGAAVRAYVKEHAQPKTRNWRESARLLGLAYPQDGGEPAETKGGLAQRWAERDVRSFDGHDIWTVTDEARRQGVPGIAARNDGISDNRARALFVALSSFFSWLKRDRRVEVNPCAAVSRPAGAKARDRALTPDEQRWFWQACEQADAPRVPGAPKPFAPLLRLLLLTGQRLDEVAGMTRGELSEDGATWSLAGSRTKNKRAHVVPLPPLARELTAGAKGKPGAAGFIFTTTGRSPVSGWSRMKDRLDAAMLAIARKERPGVTIEPWRLHDLRRTAVTGMAELGVRPDVIELVVNHISGSRAGIAGVYNKSELLPERKAALERWAAHVAALVSGRTAKVVPLHKAGAS